MHHFFTFFSIGLFYNIIMENKCYNKKQFNNYLINNQLKEAYQYLLKTNNLELLLRYKLKFKRFKVSKNNKTEIGNFLIKIKRFYYHKFINFLSDEDIVEEFNILISELKKFSNIYYFISKQDLLIFQKIEIISLDVKVLEGVYNLRINVISDFLFKGWLNYISLGTLSIKSFIYNNELYVFKSIYNKNINSKKFKLFLIYHAQYLYDINKHNYCEEEMKRRANKLVLLYKNKDNKID